MSQVFDAVTESQVKIIMAMPKKNGTTCWPGYAVELRELRDW